MPNNKTEVQTLSDLNFNLSFRVHSSDETRKEDTEYNLKTLMEYVLTKDKYTALSGIKSEYHTKTRGATIKKPNEAILEIVNDYARLHSEEKEKLGILNVGYDTLQVNYLDVCNEYLEKIEKYNIKLSKKKEQIKENSKKIENRKKAENLTETEKNNIKSQKTKIEIEIRKTEKNDNNNAYIFIKRAALKGIAKAGIENVPAMAKFENNRDTLNKKFINDILKLLKSGDEWDRGSSPEYKEMKSEVAKLKKYCNRNNLKDGEKKYVRTMLNALAKKASMYCKHRKETEIEESLDSYKGKRINIMRRVGNILSTAAGVFKEQKNLKKEDQELYKKLIEYRMGRMSYNPVLYGEVMTLNYGKQSDRKVVDEAEGIGKHYYGEHFNADDVKKLQNKIDKFYTNIAELLNDPKNVSNIKDDLRILSDGDKRGKTKYQNKITILKNSEEYPEIINGKITGIPEIDDRVLMIASNAASLTDFKANNKELIEEKWTLNKIRKFEEDAYRDGEEKERFTYKKRENVIKEEKTDDLNENLNIGALMG